MSPKKTKANTAWATNIWQEWAVSRLENITPEESAFRLDTNIVAKYGN